MEAALITATAAGLGSMVGAAASITTTWITQRTQVMRSMAEWRQRERETPVDTNCCQGRGDMRVGVELI